MLLIIDNYDSFTYNLVQLAGELGADPQVHRNDSISVEEAMALAPTALIISPGPGTPAAAGVSVDLIRATAGHIPVLGVCLGHQAIGEAFGGSVIRAGRLMHGKTASVKHTGENVFAGLENPLEVMRYHSLVVSPETLPVTLEVTAWSDDRPAGEEIMGLRHREHPVFGVQFHPESIASSAGRQLMANFLQYCAP